MRDYQIKELWLYKDGNSTNTNTLERGKGKKNQNNMQVPQTRKEYIENIKQHQ